MDDLGPYLQVPLTYLITFHILRTDLPLWVDLFRHASRHDHERGNEPSH